MKTDVKEVLVVAKGEGKVDDILTGKGSMSKSGFGDLVSALANDPTYKVTTYNPKDGTTTEESVSELLHKDLVKTVANANFPQKSEADSLLTAPMATEGLAKVIGHIIMEQIQTGKKFDLPAKEQMGGSIYLAPVEAKEKTVTVRDMKTGEVTGSVDVKTEDWIQVRVQSKTPKNKMTKVRKDVNGKVVE